VPATAGTPATVLATARGDASNSRDVRIAGFFHSLEKHRTQQGLFQSRKLAISALPGIFYKSATAGTLATAKMQVIAGKQKTARTPGTPTGARTLAIGVSTAAQGHFAIEGTPAIARTMTSNSGNGSNISAASNSREPVAKIL
jgi:hypothetical protein